MRVVTYAEDPELALRTGEVEDTFPHFASETEALEKHWSKLRQELPHLQLLLWDDENDRLVGHARTLPAREAEGLPGGIDGMLVDYFERGIEPDVLSAMVAVVDRAHHGRGLSRLLLEGMREVAAREGFTSLIAPVRPTWKERYPLIPMERYMRWTRDDGLPFDPWLRVHARLGAELLDVCPSSMTVDAAREQWEEWTGMQFPEDGEYVVPGALVPVVFAAGRGSYVEPNVWMRHSV